MGIAPNIRRVEERDIQTVVCFAEKLCKSARCSRFFDVHKGDTGSLIQLGIVLPESVCSAVAEIDGHIIGAIVGTKAQNLLCRSHNYAQEIILWVEPEHRSCGAGRALMDYFISWAERNGMKSVSAGYTHGLGERAIDKLLRSFGMEPVETHYARSL